jgi:cellulose synthase/poly-beta-1,6-N-acetylglucosamine synthase-like glycosyltransferase
MLVMSWSLSIFLIVVNGAILPYLGYLLLVTAAAFLPRRKARRAATPSSRFLIVIPAHDEEPVIAKVVQSCLEVDYPRAFFDVLVISDNSSDRTAALAEAAGARVIERLDETQKSKGHAIDYLIGHLEQSGELGNIDALVIVDADSTVDRGLLLAFDQDLRSGRDWIQSYYTVANPDDSWRTRLLTFAFSLFNGVIPLGQARLGLSGVFKGNGMCLSVRGLRRVPWHCHGLVEDMEYSWVLRLAGEHVSFRPDVSVHGEMLAAGGEAAMNQRRRWEFGRAETRRKFLAPLLRSTRVSLWNKMFGVCELTMPTTGSFVVLCAGVLAIDLLYVLGLLSPPLLLLRPLLIVFCGLITLTLGLYFISPFVAMRLPWRYALSVGAFPIYYLWKIRLSLGSPPDRWVRTPRATGQKLWQSPVERGRIVRTRKEP